jgi:hypothetical protein
VGEEKNSGKSKLKVVGFILVKRGIEKFSLLVLHRTTKINLVKLVNDEYIYACVRRIKLIIEVTVKALRAIVNALSCTARF